MKKITIRPIYRAGRRTLLRTWFGVFIDGELFCASPRYPSQLVKGLTQ